MDKKMSLIEQKLLDREIDAIREEIAEIGKQLTDVFSKYGPISGDISTDLAEYIATTVISADSYYFAGYTTRAGLRLNKKEIPETVLEAIRKHVVDDFLAKAEEIANLLNQ